MVAQDLAERAFAVYLDSVRQGTADAYAAYRVCDESWRVDQQDAELLRLAARQLIMADPWILATHPLVLLRGLGPSDLEELTPFVGAGSAGEVAAQLRAKLWYYAGGAPFRRDRAGRAQLRRALAFLRRVRRDQRDQHWHEMLVGCYRVLDYDRYPRAVAGLLRATKPEDRAFTLRDALEAATARKDWSTYDRFRRQWEQLPAGHHSCACYENDVSTYDGLRAAAARRWDDIPEALRKAAAVNGCPHLNSGGLRLGLVRLLLAKRKHLDAAAAYLDRAAEFPAGGQEAIALKQRIQAAARRK